MNKNYHVFLILGIVFTIVLGTLLHFVYGWSGNNSFVGLFAPINESVWEHLKLLFYPMSLWILFGSFKYGKRNKNYVCAAIIGLLTGMIVIPLLYYATVPLWGPDNMYANIAIFILGVMIAYLVMGYILKNYNLRFLGLKSGFFVWEVLFVLFVIFTIFPPDVMLFQPPGKV